MLVTGASSGLGEATMKLLATSGFRVFAGVRSARDAKKVESHSSSIKSLQLDVRKGGEIRRAVKSIKNHAGRAGLAGLVVNAGVAGAGPLEITPLQEYRRVFEINFFGAIAVIQGFIPLLRKTGGKIVIIGSASAIIPPPFLSAYTASKMALRALAASLRSELSPWGIRVSLVEPGVIRTPIWEKGRSAGDQFLNDMGGNDSMAFYRDRLKRFGSALWRISRNGMSAQAVSQKIKSLLTSQNPAAYTAVGIDAKIQFLMTFLLPVRIRDFLITKMLFPSG